MSEDTLLKALASRVREQQSQSTGDEALWERYAAGQLSDEELQDLLSRTPTEDAERMQAVFAPLEQDFKEQIVNAATETLSADGSPDHSKTGANTTNVVSIQSRRNKLYAPLAVAATLLLAIGTWQFGSGSSRSLPLPEYELSVLGGSAFRSAEAQQPILEYASGDRLDIRLTPATRVDGAVQGRVYAQTSQGFVPLSAMKVEIAPAGAMRISGRIGDEVVLNSGVNTVVVVIGQQTDSPDAAELFRRFEQGGSEHLELKGKDWHAWRIELVFDAQS